jgi:hypothetical protein
MTYSPTARASAAAVLVILSSCAEDAAPPPDLSGLWARDSLEFEEPASGPGPIGTMLRQPDGKPVMEKVGDYTNPILLPAAAEKIKALGDLARNGVVFPDPENQCQHWPLPNILRYMQVEILQQPDRVTILYVRSHQVRQVRLNESHPANVIPSSYGDSVGRYEGDTLVVDTIGVKVGPLAMIDWYGTPYSEALHVVERYRLIDYEAAKESVERHERRSLRIPSEDSGIPVDLAYKGKGLQIEITVEDPNVFTMPWSALVTYRRTASGWVEEVCAENLRESVGPERKVPTAVVPDF